jgi:hypothetical protein
MKDACSATSFRQWTLRGLLDIASAATGSSRRRMKECFHVSRKTSSSGESLGNQFRKPENTLCGGFAAAGVGHAKASTGIIMMPSATLHTEADAR